MDKNLQDCLRLKTDVTFLKAEIACKVARDGELLIMDYCIKKELQNRGI